MKLDLACGQSPMEGYVGIDLNDQGRHDIVVMDLFQYPWEIGTEHIDAVWCSHFVEHVPDLIGFMNEVHRILVPDGVAVITHPYQHHVRAWQDPTHVRALNEASWLYYNRKWREEQKLDHYNITADFEIDHIDTFPDEVWLELSKTDEQAYLTAARNYVNVIADLRVYLHKVGGDDSMTKGDG